MSAGYSSDLNERLDAETSDVAILWASQSGTAERLAGRLAKDLRGRFAAKVQCIDVSEVAPASLMNVCEKKIVLFMASTFGEGDPSDNLHQLWSWLRESQSIDLSNLNFLAFGLGNSNYKHYNHVIDVLEEELRKRGARMLMETGKADDATGETEEHFLDWKLKVFKFFQNTLDYEQHEARYIPSIEVTESLSIIPDDVWHGSPYVARSSSEQSEIVPIPVLRKKVLSENSPKRTCLHVDLDISHNPRMKYKTGDYLSVWPINPAQEVNLLLRALGRDDKRSSPMTIASLDSSKLNIPSPTTLDAAFHSYLEICSPTPRETIACLLPYAPTTAAHIFLKSIADDKATYATHLTTNYLNIGRLLTAACSEPGAWSSVPVSFIFETIPPMQPRSYSISSSSVASPRQVSITVAASDTTTLNSPERAIGVTSNYLLLTKNEDHPLGLTYGQNLDCGQMYAAIRKSNFKLPLTASAPVIMIGAGTGVAPFRAFVQERARLKSVSREVGPTKLYFGCRNAAQDHLYADEFAAWADQLGDCFSITTAFSRPDSGEPKQYVQDCVQQDAETLCRLLVDENAYMYICGSAAMARDVSATISKMLMHSRSWTDEEMAGFADRQKRQRRWLQDVWG